MGPGPQPRDRRQVRRRGGGCLAHRRRRTRQPLRLLYSLLAFGFWVPTSGFASTPWNRSWLFRQGTGPGLARLPTMRSQYGDRQKWWKVTRRQRQATFLGGSSSTSHEFGKRWARKHREHHHARLTRQPYENYGADFYFPPVRDGHGRAAFESVRRNTHQRGRLHAFPATRLWRNIHRRDHRRGVRVSTASLTRGQAAYNAMHTTWAVGRKPCVRTRPSPKLVLTNNRRPASTPCARRRRTTDYDALSDKPASGRNAEQLDHIESLARTATDVADRR